VLADGVIEQHEPRALRSWPNLGADDARRGEVALEDVRLEIVVEEVRGAAGQQADDVVEDALVHRSEARAQRRQRQQLLRIVAEEVRRGRVEKRLDRMTDHLHVVGVDRIGVRVVLAVPGDLLDVLVVILAEPPVVAVLHRRERRGHQQRHEAVFGQLQLVDDVRPEQAQRVREGGEREPGVQLLRDRGAANELPSLQDQGLEPRLRQVRSIDQAVVAATDDDGVVGSVGGLRGRLGLRCRCRGWFGRGRCFRHVRPSFGLGCRAASVRSLP
jgi:hypothetical protein